MLSLEMVDEIVERSAKGHLLSKELIEKIIIEEVSQCDPYTQKKFEKVKFQKLSGTTMGGFIDGVILLDLDFLEAMYSKSEVSFLYHNIYTICNVFHEIEHLQEEAKILRPQFFGDEFNKSIERKLLEISSYNYLRAIFLPSSLSLTTTIERRFAESTASMKLDKIIEKLYFIFPNEKLADFNAALKVQKSLLNFTDFRETYTSEFNFLSYIQLYNLMRGYESEKTKNIIMPLYDYLEGIGMLNIIADFEGYSPDKEEFLSNVRQSEPDLAKRMLYGLPASKEEVENLRENYVKKKTFDFEK